MVNEADNNLSGYSIDRKDGGLTSITGSPFSTGGRPRSVAVTPNSKFAYVANFFDGTVSGYSVDPKTGVLTQVPASPPTGSMPRSVAVDITGQFVYVTNSGSNNVSAYTIDCAGSLTPLSGSPFPADLGAAAIAITK